MVRWASVGYPELLKPDGTWDTHLNEWNVMTNGHYFTDDEDKAMEMAKELLDEEEFRADANGAGPA